MKHSSGTKPGRKRPGARKPSAKGGAIHRHSRSKDAPFAVDVTDDGDIATPKHVLSDDEIKEQEDRRS
ncbi:MAG: hypothetical protein EKK40_02140 [Bradyrhizobiaceae bacterium]|nr:MAG: hypothetical protein EKK40_02140 [Bradyrhizobiaceae bacterium]